MADQPVEDVSSHPFTVHEGAQTSEIAECAWGMKPGDLRAVCGGSRFAKRHAGHGVVVLRNEPLTVVVGAAGMPAQGKGGYAGSDAVPEFAFPKAKVAEWSDLIPAVQAWDVAATRARDTIVRKSKGYGDAWVEQGYMGNLARVLSKTARLKNIAWRDTPFEHGDEEASSPEEESLLETLHDLMALAAFMAANIEEGNRWGR